MVCSNLRRVCFRVGFGIGFLLLVTIPVAAETLRIRMPQDFANYAMEPTTGDLVAVDAEKHRAVLFRRDALNEGKAEIAKEVRVGSTPVSVCFKKYQKQQVFAVVCSQDSHMYVINASDFSLLKKIPVTAEGVTNVTSSLNVNDPFLYYNYGGGHGSSAGAVSLATLSDVGLVMGSTMDTVVSADGQVAYRRGPWSPSGFESLVLSNRLSDPKPNFVRQFYEHNSVGAYLPDPFNEFTFAGSYVYTKSLDKKVASVNFIPMAFFRTRPMIVGVNLLPGGSSQEDLLSRGCELSAVSYNTFVLFPQKVKILAEKVGDGSLPRGVSGQGDFKQVRKQLRVFADDERNSVVYAARNIVSIVPVADFAPPDEPLLSASLTGADNLLISTAAKMSIETADPRVEFKIDDMPEGMTEEGGKIKWTPGTDQVGAFTIAATLKAGELQRSVRLTGRVSYPSVELPLSAIGLSVDPEGKRAVVWNGPRFDPRRPGTTSSGQQGVNAPLTLVSFELSKPTGFTELKLQNVPGAVRVTSEHVFVISLSEPKVEIYRATDLKRLKVILTTGPVSDLVIRNNHILIQTQTDIESYSLMDFSRIKSVELPQSNFNRFNNGLPPKYIGEEGIIHGGQLLDDDLNVKLIGEVPQPLRSMSNFAPQWLQRLQLPDPNSRANLGQSAVQILIDGTRIGPLSIPDSSANVTLTSRLRSERGRGALNMPRDSFELGMEVNDSASKQPPRVVFTRDIAPVDQTEVAPSPVLAVARGAVYVAYHNRLYSWQSDTKTGPAAGLTALQWDHKQSALTLSPESKTVLSHTVSGGKGPYRFSFVAPFEGMSVDASTGKVTLDNAKIVTEAVKAVIAMAKTIPQDQDLKSGLRNYVVATSEAGTKLIGRRITGLPVAVPIQLQVEDQEKKALGVQYSIIVEVPMELLNPHLATIETERQKMFVEAGGRLPSTGKPRSDSNPRSDKGADPATDEIAALRERVETLEQQVKLLTRAINNLNDGKRPAPSDQ